MSLLDRFRALLGAATGSEQIDPPAYRSMPTSDKLPRDTEARALVADIVGQAVAASNAGDNWRVKLSDSERWKALKSQPAEVQRTVLVAAIDPPRRGGITYQGDSYKVSEAKKQIVSQLLRRKLDLPVDLLQVLLERWLAGGYTLEYTDVPGPPILGAVEQLTSAEELPPQLRPALKKLRAKALAPQYLNKFNQGVADRIGALLDPQAAESAPTIPPGAFGDCLRDQLSELSAAERNAWLALVPHAIKAGDKSAPSAKWLAEARPLLNAIGAQTFAATLSRWLGATTPDPQHPDSSLDVLKGMIWLLPGVADDGTPGAIGRFAETCFRKVRGIGARSVKLGNACLYALSEMSEHPQAGAELFRLREAVKYPSARAMLDKRITELADKSGTGIAALEDAALPDYGLGSDGVLRRAFGDCEAVLSLTANETDLAWTGNGGKPVKTVPAAVKRDHKEALDAFKLLAKDIEKARAAQARRLEDGWLERRDWALGDWCRHYLAHPLRRPLVEALIWQATDGGGTTAFLPADGALRDLSGAAIELADDARIALWHPLQAQPEEVLAWRARIVELDLTQPIKQAHREIYVITDAEIATETYSNRFAAHILRQHQFRALCHARGWQFEFLGGWDNWNVPTRHVPALALSVEYSVEPIEDGQHSDAYVPLHLASDQVRFVDGQTGRPMPLVDVDPVAFSELMRDVDLFVAVTSVAADPGWQDGGPHGRFGTYWRDWAFGDLGQSAQTRKELIAGIAPRLSIADKLEVGDKALLVTGKRHRYAIHFGSANIQILPQNRYLCIVPDRTPAEAAKIRLPFAGDGQLSTILAKAFMLVDESKITDATILRQL